MSVDELFALAAQHASAHAPFGARTTYRVGGTARVVLEVEDLGALERYSRALATCEIPLVVLGNGSNLLVADEEFAGVVVVLGHGFATLSWRDEADHVVVEAGGALDLPVAARRLSDDGVVNFEWAVGVPGTMGGAAVMNAGGHGSDMAHVVHSLTTWSLDEHRARTWSVEQLDYGYRHSALTSRDIVVGVTLTLARGSREEAREKLREIVRWRREHQPGGANAGSVFRNPDGASAGALIEQAGLKGFRHGSAYVSDKHANFIQVDSAGRASDVLELMMTVRDVVRERTGVTLISELRTVGFESRWP